MKFKPGDTLINKDIEYKILRVDYSETLKYVMFMRFVDENSRKVGEKEFCISCDFIDRSSEWSLKKSIYKPSTLSDKMY